MTPKVREAPIYHAGKPEAKVYQEKDKVEGFP